MWVLDLNNFMTWYEPNIFYHVVMHKIIALCQQNFLLPNLSNSTAASASFKCDNVQLGQIMEVSFS